MSYFNSKRPLFLLNGGIGVLQLTLYGFVLDVDRQTCDLCGKHFESEYSLQHHKDHWHTGKLCQYAFFNNTSFFINVTQPSRSKFVFTIEIIHIKPLFDIFRKMRHAILRSKFALIRLISPQI